MKRRLDIVPKGLVFYCDYFFYKYFVPTGLIDISSIDGIVEPLDELGTALGVIVTILTSCGQY